MLIESELIEKIKSFGAFIEEKFYDLFSEENMKLGEKLFREYQNDISISTGGLYLAKPLAVDEYWGNLVKEHFTNLKDMKPKTAIEINNKAFAYDTFGFYYDPSEKPRSMRTICYKFGIDGFRAVQPMFEEAIKKDPSLWEPRYNIAGGLISLFTWGEHPEQDRLDEERAFKELEKVLELDPDNVPARITLARIFYNYVNPYQLLEEALELDPDNELAKTELEIFRKARYDFEEHSVVSLINKATRDYFEDRKN